MSRETDKRCGTGCHCGPVVNRRDFLKLTGGSSLAVLASRMPVMAGPFAPEDFEKLVPADKKLSPEWVASLFERGTPQTYAGEDLRFIGMPVGGLCAGQLYLGGDGALWHWDIFNEHIATFQEHYARPLPRQFPLEQGFALRLTANGKTTTRTLDQQGYPNVRFRGEYPIGIVTYDDPVVSVELEAFSPFIPLRVDDSSLPATVMRYTLTNRSGEALDADLYGWLENAVGNKSRNLPGVRRNAIRRAGGYTLVHGSAEGSDKDTTSDHPDILFEDWNRETYQGWTVEGAAFGSGPIRKSDIPAHQGDVGGDTERVVNSHASAPGGDIGGKDAAVGVLTSRPFKIERDFINVWVGGGSHKDRTYVGLLVDGTVERTVSGRNDNKMALVSMDVHDFIGREGRLKIVDSESGGWGNIGVGRITFSDKPVEAGKLEDKPDFGTMALALLGDEAEFAAAADGKRGPGEAAGDDAAVPLREKLVGAVGRRVHLTPGQSAVVTFVIAWNFPNLRMPGQGRHYATRFATAEHTVRHIAENIETLYGGTRLWRDTWYDSTLPYWFLDRTFANASILATSTAFRFADGRFWGWEGVGCCAGTCTHVWHYEQTMGRIFPELDILLREKTDFNPAAAFQADGAIGYRGGGGFAVDGQAGIILRCLRDHQVSPDSAFLKRNWANIRKSLEWLMAQDINSDGLLDKNQHNTLDAEWHGQVAWLSGLYLAALRAGEVMALEMGDAAFAATCRKILEIGRRSLVEKTWNGEYFLHVGDPAHANTVGSYDGCEIDQVLGQGWAYQVALGAVLPPEETRTALKSLWKYNFTPDVGPYREKYKAGRWYAMAGEAGTLMCTWPRGDGKRVTTGYDFYFNECMNGFEYQLAGHMIWENMLQEGLAITRAVHDRYDGSKRNPWNEVECGDHYARSMASYGVFLAVCGFEYHGPNGHIGFAPRLKPENFKCAFTAAEGWGTYSQRLEGGKLSAEVAVKHGRLRLKTLAFALDQKPGEVTVLVDGKKRGCDFTFTTGRLRVTLDKQDVVIEAGGKIEIRT